MIWLGIVEPKKGPSTFNQHIKDRNLSNTNRNCTWLKSLGKLAGDSLASRTLASGNQVDVDFPACVLLPDGRFFYTRSTGGILGYLGDCPVERQILICFNGMEEDRMFRERGAAMDRPMGTGNQYLPR